MLWLNSWGIVISKVLVKYGRNTDPYILASILKVFPSFSLSATIIGTTFSYAVSMFGRNFCFLGTHLETQILALVWMVPSCMKINKESGLQYECDGIKCLQNKITWGMSISDRSLASNMNCYFIDIPSLVS